MTLGQLVAGLLKRGVEVTVIAPNRPDRLEEAGTPYTFVGVPGFPLPRYPELRFGWPAPARLQAIWSRTRPDLVHIATEGPLGWSALRAADACQIPAVSSFHTNFHSYGRHYGFGFLKSAVLLWLRHCHNRSLRTFVPSSDLLESLRAGGFQNLRLFSRGVDTSLFGPHQRDDRLRQSWGASHGTPVALYTGRLAGEKNLELVIRTWQEMRGELPDLKLVLVGDGPDLRRLQALAPEAHFAGMQGGQNLAAHYASADCFLFASVTETFGNVVTEAMASGLPVLAYDYAAPARFIKPGHNGFLAPYDQPDAFLIQARQLARHRADWQSIGRAARETLLPHSWDRIVDSYLAELQSLPAIAA